MRVAPRQTGAVEDVERGPDRFEAVVILLVYVLPLGLTVLGLAVVGLPGLALALVAVEAVVGAFVLLAKRPEGASRRPGPLVGGLLVLAVVAAAGAAVLLAGRA